MPAMIDDPPPARRALQQSPHFAEALKAFGRTPLLLDGPDLMVVLHRRLAGLPFTMLARAALPNPGPVLDRLCETGLHRSLVILSPDHPTPDLAELGALPLISPATLAEIDLCVSKAQRYAQLHQKWRNRLTHAKAQGLRVACQPMPTDPAHWLLAADATQQRARGYRNWPPGLTLAFARTHPENTVQFTAFEGHDPIAAMLFLRHGSGVTYHIGHTTARGRQLSAHNLLLWQATNWLAASGHSWLDLGLINTQALPGLARFKLGAGATPRALGGTWLWGSHLRRVPRWFLRALAALDRSVMSPGVTNPT